MGINRPRSKAVVISSVTQGTPPDKENGEIAAESLNKKLDKLYTLARKAGNTLTEAAMTGNKVDSKARSFSEKAVKALGNQLNQIAEISHNLREEAKARLDQKGPAKTSAAPKPPQSSGPKR